ncbi:MAG: hypothetical protein HKP17_14720 [Ignavibacteriaceae bacterium]|nr:hypothetical protein [Ignavibacteriaceae bacterium]
MFNKFLIQFFLLFGLTFAHNIPSLNKSIVQSGNLEGRHGLDLNIGIYDNTNITSITSVSGINSSVVTNSSIGFMGSIAYQYWFKDYLSFRIGAGALITDVKTKTTAGAEVSSEVATVAPILTGVNFYPLQISEENSVLPYLSISAGPYIGVYNKSEVGIATVTQETIVETVIGAKLGAGLDFLIGSLFKLGVNAGYHFMGDYSRPIGSETNYSGPEYSLSFGFVF